MERDKNCVQILIGKREGKRLFGRPMRRWEYNIKMAQRNRG